jgi:hypothetical protein
MDEIKESDDTIEETGEVGSEGGSAGGEVRVVREPAVGTGSEATETWVPHDSDAEE